MNPLHHSIDNARSHYSEHQHAIILQMAQAHNCHGRPRKQQRTGTTTQALHCHHPTRNASCTARKSMLIASLIVACYEHRLAWQNLEAGDNDLNPV